jgi:two-component system sensor histidine kinase BaeS
MRLRLFLSFALIVLVSVTGVAWIARNNAARTVRSYMFGGGMANLESLAGNLEDYYQAHNSWQGVESLFDAQTSGHGYGRGLGSQGMMMGQRFILADKNGDLVFDTAASQTGGSLSASERSSAVELKVNGQTVGYLLAGGGMGYSAQDEQMVVSRLTQAALTAGLIAGGLSLLLALWLAYRLLRPVQDLIRAAQNLGQGDLEQRVQMRGHDELATLGQTFNHMADSLQKAEESRRAMTADIAHELRNPLAVQRANLEALQDGIYPLTAENLQPILEQNRLLNRLVEDLRTLALADAGQLVLDCVPTDLTALAERVIERFHPQADAQQVEVTVNRSAATAGEIVLRVDPLRIEQILNNLLSNSLRFTPPGGRVELTFELLPSDLHLRLYDTGPGIPEEALPHIFERFYRADRSRSRSEGGTGLGLAIARQLAEAHGGALEAANHPQGGAVFTLKLPLKSRSIAG